MKARLFLAVTALLLAAPLAFHVRAADAFPPVYLSEVQVENRGGLQDEDGERVPWLEIHNAGKGRVNLSGWFLTDDATNLAKWKIPLAVVLPDKYLALFASGKNRTNDPLHLHTSFRLEKATKYIALVDPATNVAWELSPRFEESRKDVSFGHPRGQRTAVGILRKPTPGRANPDSGAGFAGEVMFSRPSANFVEPFRLTLSTPAAGAVIRYTLDGSMPGTNSPAYAAPLNITNTTHIRARAFHAGLFSGPPASEAYLQLASNAVSFRSTLPLLVMDVFGRNLRTSPEDMFVRLSWHEPVNGKASLSSAPALTTRAGFRVRGSTSSGFPQSPFAVEFLDEFNDDHALAPLGLPPDSDWVLYAPNVYDPIMIHNPFIYQLSRDMGRYSPRTRFIEVFLVRDAGPVRESHYQGVYVLTEKIKVSKHRVNMNRLGSDDVAPPDVTGGYLMKFDRLGPGEFGFYGTGDRGLVYVDPKEEVITLPERAAQRDYLRGFFRNFNQALHGPQWKNPATGYRAFLDEPAAIDFHVLEVLSGNVDAMVLSTYFHKPRQGKIVCGPHWDFDRALGSIDERDANPRHWTTGPFFAGEWWPRLFSDIDFWQAWVDRWQELRGNHFSQTNLFRLIDQLCGEVREAQPREYARWGLQPRGGSYDGEIRHMKDWLSNRLDFIDEQLAAPPEMTISPNGSEAILALGRPAGTNAAIYYTLDGSDPRSAGGSVATNAIRYAAPIRVKGSMRIVARTHDPAATQTGGPPLSTPWSGPRGN